MMKSKLRILIYSTVISLSFNSCSFPDPVKKQAEMKAMKEAKKNEGKSDASKKRTETVDKPIEVKLSIDEEALTIRPVAVYSESNLKSFGTEAWKNVKPLFALKSEAEIYVLDIDSNFVEVITLIGRSGWVQKSHIKAKNRSSWNKEKYLTKKRLGTIMTRVDGYDVRVVNLWETKSSRETVVDKLVNGEQVAILQVSDEYVQLGTVNGRIGWCMKGFVKGL
jgi:hypothetical protein